MASSSGKSRRPSTAIMPALQSVTARSSSLASAYSTMRASVPSGLRIRRPYSAGSSRAKAQHRGGDALAVAPRFDQPRQGLGADQGACPRRARARRPRNPPAAGRVCSHRVRGAERLVLNHTRDRLAHALQARRPRPPTRVRSPAPCARAQARGRWPARAPPSATRPADAEPSVGPSACASPCPPPAPRKQPRSPAPSTDGAAKRPRTDRRSQRRYSAPGRNERGGRPPGSRPMSHLLRDVRRRIDGGRATPAIIDHSTSACAAAPRCLVITRGFPHHRRDA